MLKFYSDVILIRVLLFVIELSFFFFNRDNNYLLWVV